MIKHVDSSPNNRPSHQDRYMDIQYGKYLGNRRISENFLCYIEPKDSVDDFITKHSASLDRNINTYDSSISETTLTTDVHNIFKDSNTNSFHTVGHELLLPILLNNNLKMNKLMYTLALDTRKQRQNRRLKRFIKLLRKNHDHEVEEYNPNQVNSSSSHLTCKFSSDISNVYEENVKDVAQSSTIASGDNINKNSVNVEIQNLLKPQSILKPPISTEAVSLPIKKQFSKKVHYSDLQESYLCPKKIKSNLEAITSVSEDREREKINVLSQPKSLEYIENKIEHQMESVCVLIEDFKKQIHNEKDDVMWLQNQKNTTEIDDNIAKRKKNDTTDFASFISIGNNETVQPTGSCEAQQAHNTSEDKDIYEKIYEEIQKICQKINVIDQPRKLENVENKIDQLLDLIHFLSVEIKEQKSKQTDNNLFTPDIKDKTEIDCSALQYNKDNAIDSASSLNIDKYGIIKQNSSRLFELLKTLENKSLSMGNEMKGNIQANCYYGSTFKLSLTEKATKTSKSIQNTEINVSEVIMTQANSVNSDKENIDKTSQDLSTTEQQDNKETLGVLALLRLCTQFLKQLLSCVSDVQYSHLGCRKFTYLKEKTGPNYVCNICEEVFCKASMLTDHIKKHEVDLVRDCDVCKHVLETHKLDNGEQFECQFCKQQFMRAYCCELHQQSCAKRLGLRYDVDSNLILLQ